MTAHTNVKKMALERHVTRLHGMHHFRNYNRWYHVNPGGFVIDQVMGTAIPNDEIKQQGRLEFLRTLGLKPDDPRLIRARTRLGPRIWQSRRMKSPAPPEPDLAPDCAPDCTPDYEA